MNNFVNRPMEQFLRHRSLIIISTSVLLPVLIISGILLAIDITTVFNSIRETILETVGLGFIPIALWIITLVTVATLRKQFITRLKISISSILFTSAALGLLSYFHPVDGPFSNLTHGFDASLGGTVGDNIAGDATWLSYFRILAILVAGIGIAKLKFLTTTLSLVLTTGLFMYTVLYIAASGIYSILKRNSNTDLPDPEILSKQSSNSEALRIALSRQKEHEDTSVTPKPDVIDSIDNDTQPDIFIDKNNQTDSLVSEPEEISPLPTPSGRYNKFWSDKRPTQTTSSTDKELPSFVELNNPVDARPAPTADTHQWSWDLPDRNMVGTEDMGGISNDEMNNTSNTIKQTLAEYNVEVEIGQMKPGPAVTMYGLIPGWVRRYKQVKKKDEEGRLVLDEAGKPIVTSVESKTRVKVDSIISREKDLSLALKTPSIRIETPVLGESLVGIEVPNPNPSIVTLGKMMESEEYKKLHSHAKLPIVLGKGTGGESIVADLADMPHLLVAGATGSGKSVCINAIVSCLLMEKNPLEMRLLMVDPKRVELTPYNGIPHLLTPVVVETDQVVSLLKGLIAEMLNRYRRMEDVGVRNIDSYNSRMPDKMPYLVVAIDELADLMMSASFDVEQSLCRLAQLGRATGIHLIIATQRPSVDVVTGLIKANFPTRISFGVSSQIDSRTILDTVGAEKLLGRGDMLYLAVDSSRPQRVQGVFISDEESENIVRFWTANSKGSVPEISLHTIGDGGQSETPDQPETGMPSRDELIDKAIEMAQHHKKLSTSLLQRRLRIGYPRAARLMDQLEDEGVVSAGDGSKSRDVIINQV